MPRPHEWAGGDAADGVDAVNLDYADWMDSGDYFIVIPAKAGMTSKYFQILKIAPHRDSDNSKIISDLLAFGFKCAYISICFDGHLSGESMNYEV